ncbi:aldo/keto reductase [Arthrobacter sp. AZCC_0090]|uniref:aldo/keto reductase n=1 Tax=Arthrobacter sp. AZCC_0090 TaxID=2735881 RepID=UPI00161CC0EB|nr:aldo/keto reductase [Arthrobacter sp. AZCC_0090]MBB6407141.1 aryl-alcohol dehydrogenase-like predicted oxidoreductase [Arthrobacter sp. AZCC_0090]
MALVGSSTLDVFPLSLGGNVFGWTADREESFDVLDAYRDAGGDFIDTADVYSAWPPGHSGGESETIIGEWMAQRINRDSVVIGTKVSKHPSFPGLSRSNVLAAAAASLIRLGTDYIDIYYAHYDDPSVPLEETAGAFDELVRRGWVRFVGLSNYSGDRIDEWFAVAEANGFALPVVLQPQYNLVKRVPYELDLAPRVARHHLGVTPYFALAAGLLTGKYRNADDIHGTSRQSFLNRYVSDESFMVVSELRRIATERECAASSIALAWLLAQPGIAAPIASARTVEQLPDLLAAANIELTADELRRLGEVSGLVSE